MPLKIIVPLKVTAISNTFLNSTTNCRRAWLKSSALAALIKSNVCVPFLMPSHYCDVLLSKKCGTITISQLASFSKQKSKLIIICNVLQHSCAAIKLLQHLLKAFIVSVICCLDRAPLGKWLHFVQNVHSIFIRNVNLIMPSFWMNGPWM